jgi:aminoglycoside 6-adenylyltransferase
VRAVALVGSGARQEHPADEWSDLDLVLIATDPQGYLASTDWLAEIGNAWFTFPERHFEEAEFIERRVLFASGQDVDFIIPSVESAQQGFAGTFIPEIAARGLRVLLDKDGLLPVIPSATVLHANVRPSFQEFDEVVNDFWFHAAWTAKKLRRGELWVAKFCCDAYPKRLLLRMIEWHAQATQNANTWYNGRFLEQWAAPSVVGELRKAFAHYDEQDIWRALRSTIDLFHRLAGETAERLKVPYPAENAGKVLDWVARCQPRTPE